MNSLLSLICFLSVVLSPMLAGAEANLSNGQLEGEVFIVTQAAENIRLGLVEVKLYSEDEIKKHVSKRESKVKEERPDFEKEVARREKDIADLKQSQDQFKELLRQAERLRDSSASTMRRSIERTEETIELFTKLRDKATRERDAWPHSAHYFKDLPEPLTSTRTSAEGRFQLKVPTENRFALAAHATRKTPQSVEKYYWLVWVELEGKTSKNVILGNHNLMTSGSKESIISTKMD